ncbi:MAG: PAS domain-containing protein [Alphaproteobacteria bacterium]|nr:PAS domain-containing protein [Alphaproteobacteria bacterium]
MADILIHRYHEQLLAYWDELRGDRPFPKESEIDPDTIEEIWPSCFLISLDDVTRRIGYRYSYLGSELIEAYGEDANNPDVVMRLVSSAGMPMVQKFNEVAAARRPVIDENEFVNLKHLNIRYRTCMLPLGLEDGTVTHILGCMRWRSYVAEQPSPSHQDDSHGAYASTAKTV